MPVVLVTVILFCEGLLLIGLYRPDVMVADWNQIKCDKVITTAVSIILLVPKFGTDSRVSAELLLVQRLLKEKKFSLKIVSIIVTLI